MRIAYIHGANCSARSFRYIQMALPSHDKLNVAYSVDIPLVDNVEAVRQLLIDWSQGEEFQIVSHSLGGVMAIHLHELENLDKTFTMSAPFGGSKFIKYLRWICPGYRLFADLKTDSPGIKKVLSTELMKPVTSVVTGGGGNPLFGEKNDGTVSVDSQLALKGPRYLEYDLHHFEVLLSDRVIEDIKEFLF